MYLTNLYLERFGERFDLRVDGLAEGLNIVFAPPGTGKTTLVHFLQTIYGGFDTTLRDRHITRGWGGTISLQIDHASYFISRYDDGRRDERLTVERPDQAAVERRQVHRLLTDLNHSLLRHAIVVDFNRRPELNELLAQIANCGLLPTKEVPPGDKQVADDPVVSEAEQHISVLRREIANIEQTLVELGQRRKTLQTQLKSAPGQSLPSRSLPIDLRAMDRKLRRWKRTLRDVVEIRKLAAQRYATRDSATHLPTAECEVELRHAIRWLSLRRNRWLEDHDLERHATQDAVKKGLAAFVERSPARPALIGELNHVKEEITRLAEVRLKWLAEIDEWELDIADRRPTATQLTESWAPILRDTTEFLRRLTGNDDVRVQLSDRFETWIENQAGERTRYEQLERGVRDQLYLAFCLAVAMANQRWGRQIPLVLNGIFTHFPSQKVRHALEFLMAFSRGQQIVCLTRHEHVVSVARLLNIPVRSLCSGEQAVESTRSAQWVSPSVPAMLAEPNHHKTVVSRLSERAADELTERLGYLGRSATTDLVDAANTLEGAPAGFDYSASTIHSQTGRDNSYCLSEHDPIERTPSLDATNAQRLRKIGLLRVGDLLRVPTEDVAYDLRHTGVSIDMIESWRAQARLMCRVPGLRTYDARILVACGIHDPEQLIQMQPGLLRARVKEFATSAEGQAILMSGTEFELSRVTDWINSARDLPRSAVSGPVARSSAEDRSAEQPPQARRVRRSVGRTRRNIQHSIEPPVETKAKSKANVVQLTHDAATQSHYLRLNDSVAAIPWLGSTVIRRLQKTGISSVALFLETSAESIADKLKLSRVRLDTIHRWQAQLKLVCAIPQLRFQDARVLNALGITSLELLASTSPSELWQNVTSFCQSPKGRRLLGNCRLADQDQVSAWVTSARQFHPLRAA